MDQVDYKILSLLQQNARISNTEIARLSTWNMSADSASAAVQSAHQPVAKQDVAQRQGGKQQQFDADHLAWIGVNRSFRSTQNQEHADHGRGQGQRYGAPAGKLTK